MKSAVRTLLEHESGAGTTGAPHVEVDAPAVALVQCDASESLALTPTATSDSTNSERPLSNLERLVRKRFSEETSLHELASKPRVDYVSLARWEGYVTLVTGRSFEARLIATGGAAQDIDATFDVEEVDPGDRPLLVEGAIFYWDIGYENSGSGRKRVSQLTFRRIPVRRAQDVDAALAKGRANREEFAVGD